MKLKTVFIYFALICFAFQNNLFSQPNKSSVSFLKRAFKLDGKRTSEIQYFIMESKFENLNLNGSSVGHNVFRLHLKYIPSTSNGKPNAKYTCTKFEINKNDTQLVYIPQLTNWSYEFNVDENGKDEKGQVLGIDHSKFMKLVDNNGKPIQQEISYMIYNTFIDFHAFCNVFAERTISGNGIQNLKYIGDKIIHESANSKPPVDLGGSIEKGSYFQNGEITLSFKGLSLVNNSSTAVVRFDSGKSSFYIKMKPTSQMEIETNGGSHYKGDIYIDLNNYWVQKVVMDEFVLSETKLPFAPFKINMATERNTTIRNVSEKEFTLE